MRTLKDVIDYSAAPLVQWEPSIGQPPGEGKAYEDHLTHSAIAAALRAVNAQNILGIISDEARAELLIDRTVPSARNITHLTLPGAFQEAATQNLIDAVIDNAGERVSITTNVDAIQPGSKDAVFMNMIVGCVARPESHANIQNLFNLAAKCLKADGVLVIVRPNSEGGGGSTFTCVTAKEDLKPGQDCEFIVKGLEQYGAMKNLYTPDSFLKGMLEKAGFAAGETQNVRDPQSTKPEPAFLLNVHRRVKGPTQ